MKELDTEVAISATVCVWPRDGVRYAQGCKQECAAQGSRNYYTNYSLQALLYKIRIAFRSKQALAMRVESRVGLREGGRQKEREGNTKFRLYFFRVGFA